MPYCTKCGAQTEPDAAFCGACGARAERQAQVPASPPSPPSPPPRPPAREGRTRWSLIGAIIVLAALVVGVVALYDAAANDGDWGESLFGGGGEDAIVAASSPTPEATARLEPTVVFTPASGYATPEEAIYAFLKEFDWDYVGDCDTADRDTDVGMQCSFLWEDRSDTLIYVVGFTFSEPHTWLRLAQQGGGDDWAVVDVAEFVPGPQDTVPPWP